MYSTPIVDSTYHDHHQHAPEIKEMTYIRDSSYAPRKLRELKFFNLHDACSTMQGFRHRLLEFMMLDMNTVRMLVGQNLNVIIPWTCSKTFDEVSQIIDDIQYNARRLGTEFDWCNKVDNSSKHVELCPGIHESDAKTIAYAFKKVQTNANKLIGHCTIYYGSLLMQSLDDLRSTTGYFLSRREYGKSTQNVMADLAPR